MGPSLIIFFSLLGVIGFMALFVLFAYFKEDKEKPTLCLYALTPLRKVNTLHYQTLYKLDQFMEAIKNYDNRPFKLRKAAFNRELGRIYPDCINWRGKIVLDWSFLNKKMPGIWVSWGSLPPDRQREIREKHTTLEAYQTEHSSPMTRPQDVEREFALMKPGPLYVNLENNAVLGWIEVPETELEILYLKRPVKHL